MIMTKENEEVLESDCVLDINSLTMQGLEEEFKKHNYIASKEIIYAVYIALKLKKPILITGKPGVGKTEIAKVLSKIFNTDFVRLQCFEGIDANKVLYDFNYPKQLLYQSLLKDKLIGNMKAETFNEAVEFLDESTDFYGNSFLIERPVLKALNPENKNRTTLLIDELDKADLEVEAYLLEALSDYSLSIPEIGTIEANKENLPLVIITSNNQREISEAFKRRCVYLDIKYPSVEQESKIIQLKAMTTKEFSLMIAGLLNNIRNNLDLKHYPSISESVEWANLLFNIFNIKEVSEVYKEEILNSLSILGKNSLDIEKIKKLLDTII